MSRRRIPGVPFAIACILLLCWLLAEYGGQPTNDVGIFLAMGRSMAEKGGYADVDTFTYTVAGTHYLNGAWASCLVFLDVWRLGGYALLVALPPLLIGLTLAIVARAASKSAGAGPTVGWVTLLSALLMVDNYFLRPQLLVLPLFALLASRVMSDDPGRKDLALGVVVTALWTNLHGSFPIAAVLCALVAGGHALERSWGRVKMVAAIGAACCLGMLINPRGWGILGYVLGNIGGSAGKGITEWSPPGLHDPIGIMLALVVATLAALFLRTRRTLAPRDLPLIAGFFLLSLTGMRYAVWLAVVLPIAVARAFPGTRQKGSGLSLLSALPMLAILLIAAVKVSPWVATRGEDDDGVAARVFAGESPVRACAWGASHGLSGRVFSSMEWGGWIEWRLPAAQTFADARVWIFPAGIWQEYLDISDAKGDFKGALKRRDVQWAILRRHNSNDAGLLKALSLSPFWERAYQDSDAVVFRLGDTATAQQL